MKPWLGLLLIIGIFTLVPGALILWHILKALGDADLMVEAMMREEETMDRREPGGSYKD